MHEQTLGYSLRQMKLLGDQPVTVDTEHWPPPKDSFGALSGLWPTPNGPATKTKSRDVWMVAVTVFDLDDYIEDVEDQRGDSRWWRQNHFSQIAPLRESDGWEFLGYDVANSWLQVNSARRRSRELFQNYDAADAFRENEDDYEDLEVFVFGVYRRI